MNPKLLAALTLLACATAAKADVVYVAMICASPEAMERAARAGVKPPCSVPTGAIFGTLEECERYTAKFRIIRCTATSATCRDYAEWTKQARRPGPASLDRL